MQDVDLKRDGRTKPAYKEAARRGRKTGVDAPGRNSDAAKRLLDGLGEEVCCWLGYGVAQGRGSAWWLLALTPTRLIACAPTPGEPAISTPTGGWQSVLDGNDLLIDLGGTKDSLRVRGANYLPHVLRGRSGRRVEMPTAVTVMDHEPAPATTAPARESFDDVESFPAHRPAALIETWQDAENLAVAYMRQVGFPDARATAAGNDGGLDVSAAEAVGQVKHYGAAVGAPTIQQLKGAAYDRAWACFFALSGYTRQAYRFAAEVGVALFTYTAEGEVKPANESARYLHRLRLSDERPDVQALAREVVIAREANDFLERAMRGLVRQSEDALGLRMTGRRGAAAADLARSECARLAADYEGLQQREFVPLREVRDLTKAFLEASDRVTEAINRAHRIF